MPNKNSPGPAIGVKAGPVVVLGDTTHITRSYGVPREQWAAVAAQRYAKRGWKVGPLDGKRPLGSAVPRGFKDFTTDAVNCPRFCSV